MSQETTKASPKETLRQEVLRAYQLAHGIQIVRPGEDASGAEEIPASGLLSKMALKLLGGGGDPTVSMRRVEKDSEPLRQLYYKNIAARRMVDKLLAMNRLNRQSVGLGV